MSKRGARGRFLDASRVAENETFVAYIDESGDEGFSFRPGCSEWFILSAAIVRKAEDLQMVELVKTVKHALGKSTKKALHFRDLEHEERVLFSRHIAAANLRTISIMVHKPSLTSPEAFNENYRLYFYAVRFLCERISWYCRNNRIPRDQGNGEVRLIFSNRSSMSYFDMRQYLSKLERMSGEGLYEPQIHWPAIDTRRMETHTAGKRAGLQVADAVAGSFYYAAEYSSLGLTEDCYARMLKPVVYCHGKKHLWIRVEIFSTSQRSAANDRGALGLGVVGILVKKQAPGLRIPLLLELPSLRTT